MLLHDARRDARVNEAGELVLLEHQDRSRWHREQIQEGITILKKALARQQPDVYQLQAAISAIRVARAFTGRDRIVKFEGCYHGHGDAFLVKAGSGATTLGVPTSPGVPKAVGSSGAQSLRSGAPSSSSFVSAQSSSPSQTE